MLPYMCFKGPVSFDEAIPLKLYEGVVQSHAASSHLPQGLGRLSSYRGRLTSFQSYKAQALIPGSKYLVATGSRGRKAAPEAGRARSGHWQGSDCGHARTMWNCALGDPGSPWHTEFKVVWDMVFQFYSNTKI